MLLCSPILRSVNYETHEERNPSRSTMSGFSRGPSISASNQKPRGYLHEGRPDILAYSRSGLQDNLDPSPTTLVSSSISNSQTISPIGAIVPQSTLPMTTSTFESPLAFDSRHNSIPHDHGLWQSAVTYRPSPERELDIAAIMPLTTQNLTMPMGTSSWTTQNAIGTADWHSGTDLSTFVNTRLTQSGFPDWSAIENTASWQASMASLAPVPATTIDGFSSITDPIPAVPYRQDSFWGYKPQASTELPAYADMEISADIPYPNVFPEVLQELSPRMHPAFDTKTAISTGLIQDMPSTMEEPLLSSADKEAITTTLAKSRSCHTHSHHGGVTKTKIIPKGGRVGPLTVSQREKVEDMRAYGACWRCRKYKKPCNGPGICNTCNTSGFRVWPSALGCRRGDFDSFAFGMIPTHSEQIVGQMIVTWDKPASWRRLAKLYRSELVLPPAAMQGDKFEALMYKVQRTQLTGPGVMELLQIACNLQRGLVKESRVLANTLKGLSHACEFYSCFVSTEGTSMTLSGRQDMVNIFTQNRKALLTTLSSFLNSCLTGRMKDWLPTFLSANFIVYTFVMLSDAAVMVPPQFRDKLWNSIKAIILDFRGILYPMAQDLLSALGKGSKLLHMQCWTSSEKASEDPGQPSTWERNSEGMKILDNDIAIFDGLRALQLWLERFGSLMRGDAWYTSGVHTVDVLPVCSWERMFDFSPRG